MLIAWAIALLVLGLSGEWLLLPAVWPYDDAPPPALSWSLRAVYAALALWGALSIALRRRLLVQKLNLSLFMLLVPIPVCLELALRATFLLADSPTRHPKHYADWSSDDDYWKLHGRWLGKWAPAPERVHPLLGWSQARVTPDNPWGLLTETRERLAPSDRPKVLFYGDSFVEGLAEPPFWIPNHMDRELPATDVVHLGVGGFGTDQIHLLFRETNGLAEAPFVIFGVMTYDLDRAVLTVRTGLKPRLVVDDSGELQVTRTPVPRDQSEFFASAPLDFRSFLFQIVRMQVLRAIAPDQRVAEKRRLNSAILEQTVDFARQRDLEILYVVFYDPKALRLPDWREQYLKAELDRLGVPYLDTRPLLLTASRETDQPLDHYYASDGGHHNAAGNAVIGDALVRTLRERGFR